MKVECLLDTNILLYAVSRNPAHLAKKTRAIDLIENTQFGSSTQILQEFYVNVSRKAEYAMSSEAALEWIEHLEEMPCCPTDTALVKYAITLSARYRISYWDAAILAAAEALGAPVLYSEDLNDGQLYGEVRVVNPFLDAAPATGFHEPTRPIS